MRHSANTGAEFVGQPPADGALSVRDCIGNTRLAPDRPNVNTHGRQSPAGPVMDRALSGPGGRQPQSARCRSPVGRVAGVTHAPSGLTTNRADTPSRLRSARQPNPAAKPGRLDHRALHRSLLYTGDKRAATEAY